VIPKPVRCVAGVYDLRQCVSEESKLSHTNSGISSRGSDALNGVR
jgi:hypothetical protein